jgi:hypothetical protein
MDVLITANPSNQHGHTSQLSAGQRSDLVAYRTRRPQRRRMPPL